VLFLDLDGFKGVNDTLGHAAGDELLVQVAERVQTELRAADTAARFGGDEFGVLLDHVPDRDTPRMVADRLRAVLSVPFRLQGGNAAISASIGVALSSAGYDTAEELLRDADLAMYAVKSRRVPS
jgi:diguanylate cyclase (GGDEF)-like protein